MRDILIEGFCYPSNNSSRKPAQLIVREDDSFELVVEDRTVKSGSIHDLRFSDRIGSINRRIFFDSGTQLETSDNDIIDRLLAETVHKNKRAGAFNKLESSWTFALLSIALTGLLIFSFFKYGLPAAAHYAAHRIPVSASEKISDGALDFLDRFAFNESQTQVSKKDAITSRFKGHLASLPDDGGFNYTLHFRNMNGTANAFALPSGDIVVTDALVAMATDSELDSVLFHEIGHVVERHGLQGVIKGTTITVLLNIALGDLSTVAELTTGTATFLVQSSYTRAAESEADDYALSQMERSGIDPIHFANAMRKLSSQLDEDADENTIEDNSSTSSSDDDQSYLATHPSSTSRINKAIERSRIFNQQ